MLNLHLATELIQTLHRFIIKQMFESLKFALHKK